FIIIQRHYCLVSIAIFLGHGDFITIKTRFRNLIVTNIGNKSGIINTILSIAGKALEQRHQHNSDNTPKHNILKHIIIFQGKSPLFVCLKNVYPVVKVYNPLLQYKPLENDLSMLPVYALSLS